MDKEPQSLWNRTVLLTVLACLAGLVAVYWNRVVRNNNNNNNKAEMVISDEVRAKRVAALLRAQERQQEQAQQKQASSKKKPPPLDASPNGRRRSPEEVPLTHPHKSGDSKRPNRDSQRLLPKDPPNFDSSSSLKAPPPMVSDDAPVTPSQLKKTKTKRSTKPPHELLTAALKRVDPDFSTTLLKTTDWGELEESLKGQSFAPPHSSFRTLALQYGKLQGERSSSLIPELAACLQVVYTSVQQQASNLLERQAQRQVATAMARAPWVDGASASRAEVDLFSAYDDSSSDGQNASNLSGPVGDLFQLLEQGHGSLTGAFLDWKETTADYVLKVQLGQIAECLTSQQPSHVLTRLTSFSTLISRSKSVRMALGRIFLAFKRDESTGKDLEAHDALQPLFALAAYSLPWPKDNSDFNSLWKTQLETGIPNFPVGALARTSNAAVNNIFEFGRRVQASAQGIAVSIMRQVMKLSAEHKRAVFDWARHVAVSNEALADMLRGELLSPDGLTALSSSWPFLVGSSWTMIGLCSSSLVQKFEKSGCKAFNGHYLLVHAADASWNSLVPRRDKPSRPVTIPNFDGATEFFFLCCWMLRSALYPLLRVENEFHHRNRDMIASLQTLADGGQTNLPAHLQNPYRTTVSTWLGFDTFLKSREFCDVITQFTTLQLQWVCSAIEDKGVFIPDWLAKEPPRWLMHVARHHQRHLKPWQAEQVVMITTKLLTIGSQEGRSFSPLVLTELIRVASAFVAAGVSRARRKENLRNHRRGFGKQPIDYENDEVIDERTLDSYLSFDASDLGVAVFANELVCENLCPTLLKTFRALDIVEGLDVDKEASFDKFNVKVEIADLLLRLWGHPNGKCKASILRQSSTELASFACSVAAAIGYLLDDACQRFVDVTKNSKRKEVASFMPTSQRDQMFIQGQARGAVSGFLCGRRLLLLLCRLSMEPKFAASIGNNTGCASEMAAMIVHFLDVLTSSEGATNTELDWVNGTETSKALASREVSMSVSERQSLASSLVEARVKCKKEYGLDVSVLSHQLLALAARWCFPDTNNSLQVPPSSKWIGALSANEDCDPDRYRAIFERLIDSPSEPQGPSNPATLVFKHDGYVDATIWMNRSPSNEKVTDRQKQLRRSAAQEQMSHSDIDAVAGRDTIARFVHDLSEQPRATTDTSLNEEDAKHVQDALMGEECDLEEGGYGQALSEWVVSSESFSAPNDGPLQHFFDKTARNTHGAIGSGKTLTKEARKCHKGIPVPHANSAVFVCFAEERMDLCRAVITGPVDTPYSHGLFSLDVYFPPAYPSIPPLVQWMTTGGGQVRFGPNLYQDGKVCLSLLGTFHAADESQKWNPSISSLAQILLSIQTQLLTSEPYFNEPGHEAMVNTQAGKDGSRRYNGKRRLDTLRHAIISQIRHPPKGFEEVSGRHFAMCRQRIIAQARRWTLEARGSSLEERFVKAYKQLLILLSEQNYQGRPCLPPLKEDVSYLAREDPSFCLAGSPLEDSKPAAQPLRDLGAPAESITPDQATAFLAAVAASQPSTQTSTNPWSVGSTTSSNPWALPPGTASAKGDGDDEDDEFYT